MKAFVLACVVASAYAGLADILETAQAIWDEVPVTKQQALKKYGKAPKFKTTPTHQKAVEAAHINVRAQRERLGLAPIGNSNLLAAGIEAGDGFAAYENMDGFTGSVLGFFKGL